MEKNYADVLESYLIAEEGIFSRFKELVTKRNVVVQKTAHRPLAITPKARAIFKKFGNLYANLESLGYDDLAYLVEDISGSASNGGVEGLNQLTQSDLKELHNCFYNEQEALDFFMRDNQEDIDLIKTLKPLPFYSNGGGDFHCLTAKLEVREYIHDAKIAFDSPHASNYKNFREWLEKYYNHIFQD